MNIFGGQKNKNALNNIPGIAGLIFGAIRKISSRQALVVVLSLVGVGFVIYDHYRDRPNVQIIPRMLCASNRFLEVPGRSEILYTPIINASFRFINMSRQPVTVANIKARIRLRGSPIERIIAGIYMKDSIIAEFTIKPGESVIRCFDFGMYPPLVLEEAKQFERYLRENPDANDHKNKGEAKIFTRFSTIFYTDTGKVFPAKSYGEYQAQLSFESWSREDEELQEVVYRYGKTDVFLLQPEKLIDNPSCPTVYLPNNPICKVRIQTTNEMGGVKDIEMWPPVICKKTVPARRLAIGLVDDRKDVKSIKNRGAPI